MKSSRISYLLGISLSISVIFCGSLTAEPVEVSASQVALILPDSSDPDISIGPRVLAQFDLPQEFDSTHVRVAWIQFNISVPIERRDTTLTMHIYPLTTEWMQESVNWESPWNTPGGDFIDSLGQLYFLRAGNEATNRIDVTEIYRRYAAGNITNFGLIFTIEHIDRVAYRILRRLPRRFVSTLILIIE